MSHLRFLKAEIKMSEQWGDGCQMQILRERQMRRGHPTLRAGCPAALRWARCWTAAGRGSGCPGAAPALPWHGSAPLFCGLGAAVFPNLLLRADLNFTWLQRPGWAGSHTVALEITCATGAAASKTIFALLSYAPDKAAPSHSSWVSHWSVKAFSTLSSTAGKS